MSNVRNRWWARQGRTSNHSTSTSESDPIPDIPSDGPTPDDAAAGDSTANPSTLPTGAASPKDEAEALIDQARWLLEYHGRRTDSTYQRGTAVLAANGVLLGLIATAVRAATGPFDVIEQITLLVAVWLVLSSAVFSIAAIAPRKTYVPSVKDLQRLRDAADGKWSGRIHSHLLTTLLGTSDTQPAKSAVGYAEAEAGRRIAWFGWAVRWLVGAIIALVGFVAYTVWPR